MESIIKWQTLEPKEGGCYLITTTNVRIYADHWRVFTSISCWEYYNKFGVVAWCKLIDIEPYKEDAE